jgi:hypothetical protein
MRLSQAVPSDQFRPLPLAPLPNAVKTWVSTVTAIFWKGGFVRVEARIAVDGRDADRESLWDWLTREPELRGRLLAVAAPAPREAMGAPADLVVQLAGATAVWAALASSLSVWLVQRRSDVTITVTLPDGRKVSVSAKRVDGMRVADSEQIARRLLELGTATPPAPGKET